MAIFDDLALLDPRSAKIAIFGQSKPADNFHQNSCFYDFGRFLMVLDHVWGFAIRPIRIFSQF